MPRGVLRRRVRWERWASVLRARRRRRARRRERRLLGLGVGGVGVGVDEDLGAVGEDGGALSA